MELDPNFAIAYIGLAACGGYSNLGQPAKALENATKAFALRERVSERERIKKISAFYYSVGTGELDKANQSYEMWKQSYPRDPLPYGNLGNNHMMLGRWDMALLETEERLRLEASSSVAEGNLAWIRTARSAAPRMRGERSSRRSHGNWNWSPTFSGRFLSDRLPSWRPGCDAA